MKERRYQRTGFNLEVDDEIRTAYDLHNSLTPFMLNTYSNHDYSFRKALIPKS